MPPGYKVPTNAWDETSPTDNTAAASIDDEFVKLKLDVRERLEAGHFFVAAGGQPYEYVGAHVRGFVNCVMYHTTRNALRTWARNNYGTTEESWNRYSGCLHWVNEDTTPANNGLYRVTGSGTIVKICNKTSDAIEITP